MEIYSHFAISTIFCKDCISEIQQKHHVADNSRQLAPIEALFYNDCTTIIVFLNTTILQHQMLLCQNTTIALVQFRESLMW